MPVFAFDEPQKTTSEIISGQEQTLQLSPESETSLATIDEQTIDDSTIPSRTTKPLDRDLIMFLVIMVPVFLAAVAFCFDARARNFFCARALQLLHNQVDAIPFYTAALAHQPDLVALNYRAEAYKAIDDPVHERGDLMESLALNPNQNQIYVKAAALQVRCGSPEVAATLLKRYADLPPPTVFAGVSWTRWQNKEAAYNLLLLGDSKTATEFTNRLVNSDKDKIVLAALAAREEGNPIQSGALVSQLKDSDSPYLFRDSRVSYKETTAKHSMEALLALDERKAEAAQKALAPLLELIRNARFKEDMEKPIVDVMEGWLLLQQGHVEDSLELSAKLLKDDELKASIEGLNIEAALHLMRYRAFQMQGKLSAASEEETSYKSTHCSGHSFAPIWAWPK